MMGSFSLTGFVYIQGSSRRMDARLFGAEHEGETWVRIVTPDEKELACSLLQDLQIDAATGTTARKLTFLNGTVFETSDHFSFEQIEGNSRSARLHRLEQFGPHLFGFSIACLAGASILEGLPFSTSIKYPSFWFSLLREVKYILQEQFLSSKTGSCAFLSE